jgi:hypothetical protein
MDPAVAEALRRRAEVLVALVELAVGSGLEDDVAEARGAALALVRALAGALVGRGGRG